MKSLIWTRVCASLLVSATMLLSVGAQAPAALAQAAAPAPTQGSSMALTDPLGGIGLIGAVNRIILTFLGMVGAIALLVFVYAGVIYMTGDEKGVTKAKDTMKYAFIGLILIMGAYLFTTVYLNVLTQSSVAPNTTQQPIPAGQ